MRDLSNELRVIRQTAGTCYFGTCRTLHWPRIRRNLEAAGEFLATEVLGTTGKPEGVFFIATVLPGGLKRAAPHGRPGWQGRGSDVMVWSGTPGCVGHVWVEQFKRGAQGALEVSRGWAALLNRVEGATI